MSATKEKHPFERFVLIPIRFCVFLSISTINRHQNVNMRKGFFFFRNAE